MAPNDIPNPLLYTPCSQCLNEGWLFCTLCHAYFCDDHACEHLAAQVAKDVHGISYDEPTETESADESRAFFRELSAQQLTDTEEIPLYSYLRRLVSEAKRVQREIERRMVYSTEMNGRRKPYLSQDALDQLRARAKNKADLTPLGLLEREAREARAKELERKKQLAIQANIAIIAEQIKLGNITLAQVSKVVKK